MTEEREMTAPMTLLRQRSGSHYFNYSVSDRLLLPKLQSLHSVCKLSITVSPPFDHGIMWSMCNSNPGVVAGERPHIQHLKLSRFITIKRIHKLISLLVI